MSKTLAKARELIDGAEIRAVRQKSGSFKSKLRRASEAGRVEMKLDFSGKSAKGDEGVFYCVVRFVLSVQDKDEQTLVEAKSLFELEYQLPEGVKVSRKAMDTFADINGVFNAWPFFREYLQSSFQRMDLPTPMLPLFKLKDLLTGRDEATAQEESSN